MPRYKEDDWSLLLPFFANRLRLLFGDMSGEGFRPHLADGYRKPEESRALNDGKRGQLLGLSMHCFGIAADVICFEHGWQCQIAGCLFYDKLHVIAIRRGFTRVVLTGKSGVKYIDGPHVQGVPVAWQDRVRRATPEEIKEMCREYLR